MVAEKVDGLGRGAARQRGNPVEPLRGQMRRQPLRNGRGPMRMEFGYGCVDIFRQRVDDPGELDLAIGMVGKPGPLCRGLLRLGPPRAEALHGWPVKEQRAPEQAFDCFLHFGAQGIDHLAQRDQLA